MNRLKLSSRTMFTLAAVALVACTGAHAQAPSVKQPGGINLGVTSFYDGFSGAPGWAWLPNVRYTHMNSIRDANGESVPVFNDPRISTFVVSNQFAYTFSKPVGGWLPGVMAVVPTAHVRSSFGPGPSLQGGGTGMGDILAGAYLQSPPVLGEHGQPVFSQRVELDFLLPTGRYSQSSDLNQGAGYASINPYWAATLLPAPRWELSWRLHYLYNFKNNKPASGVPGGAAFNGDPVRSTQAGQAAWLNFAGSYAVTPELSLGLNGYYFKQFTDSKVNGTRLADSREQVLGIGPGMMLKFDKDKILWVNLYRETMVRNRAGANLLLNVRMAFPF